jgi:serine/threonine-protein kinase
VEKLIGQQFGTATILKELGRGNMSIVFIAFQQTLKRRIAVKLLPKKLCGERTRNRFQNEAEAASILYHPNIVPIYEVGETDDFLFMCMQLIEGIDLGQHIVKARRHPLPSKRSLPVKKAVKIIIQILDALAYAHENHIVHRDIKPENVLIEKRTQRPLISDFGIAKLLRGDDIDAGKMVGTFIYMAPEQMERTEIDGTADIYAVGVTLFNMLVQRLPLPRLDTKLDLLKYKKKSKNGYFLKKPSQLNAELNGQMDRIILKATEYLPANRYPSCKAFMDDLRQYQTDNRHDE